MLPAVEGEAPLKFRQDTLPQDGRTDGREDGLFSLFFLKEKQLEETAFLLLLSLRPSVLPLAVTRPSSFPRLIEYIS